MYRFRILAMALCLIGLGTGMSAQNTGADRRQNTRMMPGGMFPGGGMGPMGGMMPPGGGMMPFGGGGIDQFGVEFAKEMPQDKDVVVKSKADTLYNYYVENVKFGTMAKIVFSDNGAEVVGLPEDAKVEKEGAYLTITSKSVAPLAIELSGKTEDGALVLNVDAPLKLLFNNVTVKSQRGDAILSQGKGHVYAVLAEGSVNELSDCRNPEMPPMMGFPPMGGPGGFGQPGEGGGRPDMGNRPDFRPGGMPSMNRDREENPEDYHVQYGIRMKKPMMKKKLKMDGTFVCTGPLTVSGKGSLQIQSNNKVGLKSKASLMLRPGNEITVRALSGKGVNAKNEFYIYGGILNVDCSFSADKALTCGRNMYIRGGHTVVKAGGGESSEGVESKFIMQIDGGVVEVAAQDDAINAQGDLIINGGKVVAYSTTNDAVDANCNIVINGGDVFASGNGMPEGGLDCADEEGYRLFINGGTVVAVGGRHSMPDKQSRQLSIQWRLNNLEADKEYAVGGISSYKSPRTYQMGGATLLFSSPELQAGKPYTLTIDGAEAERIESLSAPLGTAGGGRWPM